MYLIHTLQQKPKWINQYRKGELSTFCGCLRGSESTCNLPYVLNGPIYLFLLGIQLMNLEVNISYDNSALQDLLQICKNHQRHNNVGISELVHPSDHLVLQQFFHNTSIVKSIWPNAPLNNLSGICLLKIHTAHAYTSYSP